jgi:virulence-associated protein VagC
VRQEGRRLILEPLDEWPEDFVEALGAWREPIERPPQQSLGQRRDPFR